MQRFLSLLAWFSESVSKESKDLWEKNGGTVCDSIDKANYFFSDNADCKDTLNVFEKFKGQSIVLFKSSWIEDTLSDSTNVSIENYILLPKHISEELELWKNQEAFQKKWNNGREQREKDWDQFREEEENASQNSPGESNSTSKNQKRQAEVSGENDKVNIDEVSVSGHSGQNKTRTPRKTKRQSTRSTKRQLHVDENRKLKRSRAASSDIDDDKPGTTENLPKMKDRKVRSTRSQKNLCEDDIEDEYVESDVDSEDSQYMKSRRTRNAKQTTTRATTRQRRKTNPDSVEDKDEGSDDQDSQEPEIREIDEAAARQKRIKKADDNAVQNDENESGYSGFGKMKTRHTKNTKEMNKTSARQKRRIEPDIEAEEDETVDSESEEENTKSISKSSRNKGKYSLRNAKKNIYSKHSVSDHGTEDVPSEKGNTESDTSTDGVDFTKSDIAQTNVSAETEENEKKIPTVSQSRPKRESALKAVQKMSVENESESDSKTLENEIESDEDEEEGSKNVPQTQKNERSNKNEKTGSLRKRRALHSSSSDLYAENEETNSQAQEPATQENSMKTSKPLSPSEINDVLGKKPKINIQEQGASPEFPRQMPATVTVATPTASVATVVIDDRNVTSPQDTMKKHKAMLIHKKVGAQSADFLYGSFAGFPHIDDFNLEEVHLADFIVNKNGCQVKLKSAR